MVANIPSVALVTAVWRRPALTAYVLEYYKRLRQRLSGRIDLHLLSVGSEGFNSRHICMESGFEYLEYPNSPLNFKWNAVIRAARIYKVDAVVIVGSDDILSTNYFEAILTTIVPGRLAVSALRDLYFLDTANCRLEYWNDYPDVMKSSAVGLGRCFPSIVLDEVDWSPWSTDIPRESGLDASCTRKMASQGIIFDTFSMEQLGVLALDVKSGLNINSWSSLGLGQGVETPCALSILNELGVSDLWGKSFL